MWIDLLFDLLSLSSVQKEMNICRVGHSKDERWQSGGCSGELGLAFLHVFALGFHQVHLEMMYSKVRTEPSTPVGTFLHNRKIICLTSVFLCS